MRPVLLSRLATIGITLIIAGLITRLYGVQVGKHMMIIGLALWLGSVLIKRTFY